MPMQGPVHLLSVALEHGTRVGASLALAGVTTTWWAMLSERATAIGTGIGRRVAAGGGVWSACKVLLLMLLGTFSPEGVLITSQLAAAALGVQGCRSVTLRSPER